MVQKIKLLEEELQHVKDSLNSGKKENKVIIERNKKLENKISHITENFRIELDSLKSTNEMLKQELITPKSIQANLEKELKNSKLFNDRLLFYLSELMKNLKSAEIIQTIKMTAQSQQNQLKLTEAQQK
jgi:hypothetical protein